MGVEPTSSAWKAEVLPLNYTRLLCCCPSTRLPGKLVEGAGFEPAKAEPSDLQSDPVDRLGTPPVLLARQNKRANFALFRRRQSITN